MARAAEAAAGSAATPTRSANSPLVQDDGVVKQCIMAGADVIGIASVDARHGQLPTPWVDLCVAHQSLRLAPTLLSGMSFRWSRSILGDTYVGVLKDLILELREDDSSVYFRVHNPVPVGCVPNSTLDLSMPDAKHTSSSMDTVKLDERLDLPVDTSHVHAVVQARAAALLREHLSLERGVEATSWTGHLERTPEQFRRAAAVLPGVRVVSVLSQLEAVITFMGSANNNIKRNMQMIAALCAEFEANFLGCDSYGSRHFRFPTTEQLCSLTEERLWELGWGYRAPRLYKLAAQLSSNGGESWLASLSELDDSAVRAQLCTLCGVGRKVADCVLLFAYARDAVVPVDTHCLQMARAFLLPPALKKKSLNAALYEQIVQCFVDAFGGEYTGWAFMTLFVGELADFRKRLSVSPSPGPEQLHLKASRHFAPDAALEGSSPKTPPGSTRRKRARLELATAEREAQPGRSGADTAVTPAPSTISRRRKGRAQGLGATRLAELKRESDVQTSSERAEMHIERVALFTAMSDGLTSCKSEPGNAGMGTRSRSRRYASLGQTDEAVLAK